MAERGQFRHARVELIRGEITDIPPQQSLHAALVSAAQEVLKIAFGNGFVIRVQLPFSVGADSEPEPDAAVVPGRPRDYVRAHPNSALLIVEVADSSLAYDLGEKASLYSEAGVADYWVADPVSGRLHVHRGPAPSGYQSVVVLSPGTRIRPLHPQASEVEVADLLP